MAHFVDREHKYEENPTVDVSFHTRSWNPHANTNSEIFPLPRSWKSSIELSVSPSPTGPEDISDRRFPPPAVHGFVHPVSGSLLPNPGSVLMEEDIQTSRTGTELPARCKNCGASVDPSEWHPTEGVTHEDETEILLFCDEDCHDEWTAE